MGTLIGWGLKGALVIVIALMVITVGANVVMGVLLALMESPTMIIAVLLLTICFGLMMGLPTLVVGAMGWRWWQTSGVTVARKREFVAPDAGGRLPVPASLLRTPHFTSKAMDIHQASYMANLTTFHYSPEQTINGAEGQMMEAAAANATPGTFWQLYSAGQLPDRGFLMGYSLDEDGEAITADWRRLYSALIGGQSGSGKSTLIRSILAQSALQGGRFVVVDPHYNSGDESLGLSLQPLRKLMLCDVASEEKQIVDALNFVYQIGQRRLSGKDQDRSPIVLVVDETTALLKRSATSKLLTDTLGQIAQETRKVGLYALCIGQNFHSDVMPTTTRDCFVSFISCRARKNVAATMTGDNEFGKMAADLATGQAVWMTPAGDVHRLAVPNCTASDLRMVANAIFEGENGGGGQMIDLQVVEPSSRPSSKASSAPSSRMVVHADLEDGAEGGREDGTEDGREDAFFINWGDPTVQQALALMKLGYSQTDIVRDAFGVKEKSGRRYQNAVEQYRLIVSGLAAMAGK